MPDVTLTAGKDAYTTSTATSTPHPQPKRPRLTSGVAAAYVVFPGLRQQVLGKSVSLAVLSCGTRGTAAQTFRADHVGAKWAPDSIVDAAPPSLRSGPATSAEPLLADGERFEIDVTAHVNNIAAGVLKDWGWKVSTNSAADNRLYGFTSGGPSWQLEVEYSDAPQPPTPLSPLGGVVSKAPTLMWDWRDLDGEDTEQVSYRVQVGTVSGSTFTATYDSGVTSSSYPQHDLQGTSFTLPSSGTTLYWRALVNDGNADSDYSDPVAFTYVPKPTVTITNPGTGVVWDSSPTFAFNVSTGTIKSYRYRVYGANGEKRYDSGRQPSSGSSVTTTMPAKDPKTGTRVLHEGRTYTLKVQIWDRSDRETTAGDTAHIGAQTTFVMDEDATPTPCDQLEVSQYGDSLWTEWAFRRVSGVTQAFEFGIGDLLIDRVDPSDLENVGTSWVYRTPAVPAYVENLCWVRAIDNGTHKRTVKSNEYAFTFELTGIWLADEDVFERRVQLLGANVDQLKKTEKRAIHSPINLPYDIDIVYALGGVAGPLTAGLSGERGNDWEADLATLKAMRSATDTVVRLAYGTVNVPVILRGVSDGLPSPDMQPFNMRHTVTLEVQQVDEFGDS